MKGKERTKNISRFLSLDDLDVPGSFRDLCDEQVTLTRNVKQYVLLPVISRTKNNLLFNKKHSVQIYQIGLGIVMFISRYQIWSCICLFLFSIHCFNFLQERQHTFIDDWLSLYPELWLHGGSSLWLCCNCCRHPDKLHIYPRCWTRTEHHHTQWAGTQTEYLTQ